MRNIFIIILFLFTVASCAKKERSINVSGQLFDPALNTVIKGAEIKLKAAKVESGVYNSNYTEIASATTDASGNYSMEVLVEKVSGYRFIVSKDNYFEIEKDVNTDDFESEDNYKADFEIYPKASIHLTIKNTSPQGMDDEIKFRFSNIETSCKTCCNNNSNTGTGPTYSYESECDVRGEKWIYINWVVTKGGSQHLFSDSIFAEAFKKTDFNINY